jgi:hypothetical protein
MRWLKPKPRAQLSSAIPMEPLWATTATPPRATVSGSEVPKSAAAPAKLRKPRQFGPHTAMPAARAMAASSRSAAMPSPPASPKPLDSTATPPAPRSAASRTLASTASRGTAMKAASTASGMADRLGYVGCPSSVDLRGFTR